MAATPTPLRVLVCGASGFLGTRIVAALSKAGHSVIAGSGSRSHPDLPHVPVDFSHDTRVDTWLPRLQGIDAVVNAVGVLRDSGRRPMQAVHTDVPAALFEACAKAGVRRIVHISALGIGRNDGDNATQYARTKRAAEAALQALPPNGPSWIALRPSVVLGKGGDATQLFRTLAALPVLAMPGPALGARLQPLYVEDLARAIGVLVDPSSTSRGVVETGGARAMTLAELIATLRSARGRRAGHGNTPDAARVLRLPAWIGVLSSRVGDLVPGVPWCTDTRVMLEVDNVASNAPLRGWLGGEPRDLRDFAAEL